MKRLFLIFISVLSCSYTIIAQNYIGKTQQQVYKDLLTRIPSDEIIQDRFSDDTLTTYILTGEETIAETWYYFKNSRCNEMLFKQPSKFTSVWVANFNKKKMQYNKQKDTWYDSEKKCEWKITNESNQKISVSCKKN